MSTLHFHPSYRAAVLVGQKRTTVRWGEELQRGPVTLLFGDDPAATPAIITRLDERALGSLTDADAQADGFGTVQELRERLRFHYPTMPDEAQVKVVHFEVDAEQSKSFQSNFCADS